MDEKPSRIELDLEESNDFSVSIYVGETMFHSIMWESTEYSVQYNGIFMGIMKKTMLGSRILTSSIDDADDVKEVQPFQTSPVEVVKEFRGVNDCFTVSSNNQLITYGKSSKVDFGIPDISSIVVYRICGDIFLIIIYSIGAAYISGYSSKRTSPTFSTTEISSNPNLDPRIEFDSKNDLAFCVKLSDSTSRNYLIDINGQITRI